MKTGCPILDTIAWYDLYRHSLPLILNDIGITKCSA